MGQRGGSKTDTLIKLLLIFFISLLSFSVGTFVGKQFSDSQHKLTLLEQNENSSQTTSALKDDLDSHPSQATAKEISKLANDFVEAEKTEIANPITKNKDKEASKDNKIGKDKESVREIAQVDNAKNKEPNNVQDVADKIAKNEVPIVNEKKEKPENPITTRLPSSIASSAIGKFTIQIASYLSEEDAKKHTQKLKDQGFSAFYLTAKVNNQSWWRVSSGLFVTRKEAMESMDKMIKEQSITAGIIQKITD